MSFEIKIGMTNSEIISLAKSSGVSEEIIEQLNSVMSSDSDEKISSQVEQYMIQSILDTGNVYVQKAVSSNAKQVSGGYVIEDSVNHMNRKNTYKNRGIKIEMSSKKAGTIYKLTAENSNKASEYTETSKDGTVQRKVSFEQENSVFDD